MQICLQTERKNAMVRKMLAMAFVLLMPVVAMLSFDGYMPEKSKHSALSSKYLSVMSTFTTPEQNNIQEEVIEPEQEMNNSVIENAKMDQNSDLAVHNETKKVINIAIKSINVYDTAKNETFSMDLEEYVVGCVLAEMPANFHAQALMAQAIATRTFTVRKTLSGINSSHPDCFVCTDSAHCQSFIHPDEYIAKGPGAKENFEKVSQAVKATQGIIAVYDGMPINAVYHAASGFETLSSSQVWGGNTPYLSGVDAPEGENPCSKEYTYSYGEFADLLSGVTTTAAECASNGESQILVTTNQNNCVEQLVVSDNTYDKIQLRDILSLRSSDFTIVQNDDDITIVTYGYGHRVGLSQYGSDVLAKQGYSYSDILKYYYQGIDFSFVM